jgi:release factor glutamine methyltransferase
LALDGGRDGLDFYREIIRRSISFLKSDGLLALEIGYDQADAVCSLMVKDYYDIQVIRDLSGNDRVIVGRLKTN